MREVQPTFAHFFGRNLQFIIASVPRTVFGESGKSLFRGLTQYKTLVIQ